VLFERVPNRILYLLLLALWRSSRQWPPGSRSHEEATSLRASIGVTGVGPVLGTATPRGAPPTLRCGEQPGGARIPVAAPRGAAGPRSASERPSSLVPTVLRRYGAGIHAPSRSRECAGRSRGRFVSCRLGSFVVSSPRPSARLLGCEDRVHLLSRQEASSSQLRRYAASADSCTLLAARRGIWRSSQAR
jgi:hypothetical protein